MTLFHKKLRLVKVCKNWPKIWSSSEPSFSTGRAWSSKAMVSSTEPLLLLHNDMDQQCYSVPWEGLGEHLCKKCHFFSFLGGELLLNSRKAYTLTQSFQWHIGSSMYQTFPWFKGLHQICCGSQQRYRGQNRRNGLFQGSIQSNLLYVGTRRSSLNPQRSSSQLVMQKDQT